MKRARRSKLRPYNHQVRRTIMFHLHHFLHCSDVVVFHAGTTIAGDKLVTSGGRVIAVSAYSPTLQGALDAAYAGVEAVSFEGKTYRRDIAHR